MIVQVVEHFGWSGNWAALGLRGGAASAEIYLMLPSGPGHVLRPLRCLRFCKTSAQEERRSVGSRRPEYLIAWNWKGQQTHALS
jgi:hypothetical protein